MSSQNKSLIVAIIGDPKYYTVKYELEEGYPVKSNVSFHAIKEKYNSDVLIIAGLSLADLSVYKDYSSCASYVKKYVTGKINNGNKIITEDNVMVAPNVYGTKFRQENRGVSLFFNFVYYNLLKFLEESKPSEILMDTTHGINYMQVMGKDAVELAVSAYTVSQGGEVTLKVYNSEPVESNNEGPYRIDEILSKRFNTSTSILSIVSNFLYPNAKNSFNKVIKDLGCNLNEIFSFANALYFGIFPYLFENNRKIDDCFEKVENKFEKLNYKNPRIEVEISDGKLEYKGESEIRDNRLVFKCPLFYIQASYLHALLYVIKKILSNYKKNSLSEYRDFAEKYTVSEVQRVIIENEIDNIENAISAKCVNEKKILSDVYEKCNSAKNQDPEKNTNKCKPDKRNFYAHAGLECNSVYIEKCGDDFCISYGDCLDNVKKILE